MQPTALDITRQGDLGGHKVAMRFDENSIAHIMSVLTDLYSDPELAVIREYSTNAWDSHVEAGQTRPIEVTTPSSMSQFFKVKDYGVGMSVDDVENIYSQYGASTKRGTNEQTGMLGLGCKSALTYTSQFSIVAVKDGIKTTVAVARIEDGTGVMEIVDLDDTDEPNSVEIIIPTKRHSLFEAKAKQFFRFWPEGRVLLNGQEPERINGDEVGKNIFLVDRLDGDYVVMGNVAYQVEHKIFKGSRPWQRPFGIVAYVPIGSINFTPSRESLHYTTLTKNTIERLEREFRAAIQQTITTAIATSKDEAEAVENLLTWAQRFPGMTTNVQYKGQPIPTQWTVDRYILWRPNSSRNSVDYYNRTVSYESIIKTLCITNFPSEKLASGQRTKIRSWMDSNDFYDRIALFEGDVPGAPWTNKVATVDWSVIKKIRLSAGNGTKSASGLRFQVVDEHGYLTDTDELDTEIDIIYYSPADYKEAHPTDAFASLTDEVQVVCLGKNRWDKFVRDFPTAVTMHKWLCDRISAAEKALTDDDKIALGIQSYQRDRLCRLDETKIDDPELVKFIRLAKQKQTDSPTRNALAKAHDLARKAARINRAMPSVETPLNKYPLAENALGYGRTHEHVYIYMNACYKVEQEKEMCDKLSA